MSEKDDLIFADENQNIDDFIHDDTWKILIVDDESEVHNITKIVLSEVVFNNRKLEFFSAYSASEAKSLLSNIPDFAIILLDVVMESDDAGLVLVKFIREDLKNLLTRIILRTGQPGQAPEETIIVNYDINDYKCKTELTSRKLFTTIISALRSYNDLLIIDLNRQGLEKIIDASKNIFVMHSMRQFSYGMLTQLISLLDLKKNALYGHASAFAATKDNNGKDFIILAGTGNFEKQINMPLKTALTSDIYQKLCQSIEQRKSEFFDKYYIGYFKSEFNSDNVVFFETNRKLTEWEKRLIDIFCANVSIAYDNLNLSQQLEEVQKDIIITLGETVEARSGETGNHVKRVAEYTKMLALLYGMNEREADVLWYASIMHDVGKISIPDHILLKPDKLTPDEYEIMKTHSKIGHSILKNADKMIFREAAIIALQHQEKYDGTGYPNKLKGTEIDINARITSLADVFDAVTSDRVYRSAWPVDKAVEYIKDQKGKHFDPQLVDVFVKNIEEFLRIRNLYLD
ncbi:DUF3369 domain-containing protein [Candidatus Dependentiae bacterium]|nr:DUF3369 domain-containing protein [Candidatus Dependentiae bacterium]